jgi:hypothetical protein
MQNLVVLKSISEREFDFAAIVYFSDAPSHPKLLSWGVVLQFSESGPLQSVKVLQNIVLVSNTTQQPLTHNTFYTHTVIIIKEARLLNKVESKTTFHYC